jgi:hypothetical protein
MLEGDLSELDTRALLSVRRGQPSRQDEPRDPVRMAGRSPYGDGGAERVADDAESFDTGVQCTRDQAVGEHVEIERPRITRGLPAPG